ncbi:hydratase [filamentous cyanobacterium CCP5]|nr:hydratase [filamentous cyanobacterium CCP5]
MQRHPRQFFASLTMAAIAGVLGASAGARLPIISQPSQLAQSYTDIIANTLYRHYQLKYPAPVMTTGLSIQQATRLQVDLIGRLSPELGPIVGFKAALTSPEAQAQIGVNHPLYGYLLEEMLLESGDSVSLGFGARPMAEADLMVRVGSEAINSATTDAELLASLDAVIPFMELPDLVYRAGAAIDGTALIAVNVGARYGVMGEPIALTPTDAWMTRLGNIRAHLFNDAGQTVATGESSQLLGHPIQVVRWLRDSLAAQGTELRAGDLLSLGSMSALVPVEAGRMGVRYFGLAPNLPPGRSLDIFINLEPPE